MKKMILYKFPHFGGRHQAPDKMYIPILLKLNTTTMKEIDIAKGNVTIAEFCGFVITNQGWHDKEGVLGLPETCFNVDKLHFHDKWEWIYSVLGRLASSEINPLSFKPMMDEIHESLWTLDPLKTFQAILKFIHWQNDLRLTGEVIDHFMKDAPTDWDYEKKWNWLMPVINKILSTSEDHKELYIYSNFIIRDRKIYISTNYLGVLEDVLNIIQKRKVKDV